MSDRNVSRLGLQFVIGMAVFGVLALLYAAGATIGQWLGWW